MKFVFLILLFLSFHSKATKYYVAKNGNDANAGTSKSTPWASLSKVNSSKFAKNDSIFFKRSDTFYGCLIVSQNNLYYGAYGTGVDPIITGFTNVSSWIRIGPNIWESSSKVSSLSNCNMVAVNGNNTAMGRYPNNGYLTYNAHENNSAIISASLTDTPNWTGGQVVIRMTHFGIDRNRIIFHSNHTIRYSSLDSNGAVPINGYGFFIQDDSLTLDTTNEWYYNPSTKKIRIYNSIRPTLVQVATIDTLVYINGFNNITFDSIAFTGSNKITIKSNNSKHVSVQNCNLNFSGLSGIDIGSTSDYFIANNNNIYNSNDVGIINDTSINVSFTNNSIKNSGVFAGMGSQFNANTTTWLTTLSVKQGIRSEGAYATISNNKIDSTGYIPIFFYGDSVLIQNNYVNTFCYVMDDGGGIYSYSEWPSRVWKTRTIRNNIILNGIGASLGTILYAGYNNQTAGIYLDASNSNFNLTGNLIYNANKGIFLNNSHEVNITRNTLYNNQYNLYISNFSKVIKMTNINIKRNIFIEYPDTVALSSADKTENIYWLLQPDSVVGKYLPASIRADSNYYFHNSTQFVIIQGHIGTYYTLSKWKAYLGQDAHSFSIPAFSRKSTAPLFYFNPTKKDSTIYFNGCYSDITGTVYANFIKLHPFGSAILFKLEKK